MRNMGDVKHSGRERVREKENFKRNITRTAVSIIRNSMTKSTSDSVNKERNNKTNFGPA